MRGTAQRSSVAIVLLLGCSTPSEVVGTPDGTTGPSTSTDASGGATMPGSTGAVNPTDGSGGATGQGADTSSTTQGVQPGTSTGETASTGEANTSGSSTGEAASTSGSSTGDEPGTSTGASPSCDELFGTAPGYLLCMETPDACHFAAQTSGDDCNAMCGLFGATCLDAFDNSVDCTIIRPDMDTCDTNRSTEICVCAK